MRSEKVKLRASRVFRSSGAISGPLGFRIHASAEYRSQPATVRGGARSYVINSLQVRDSFVTQSGKPVARRR